MYNIIFIIAIIILVLFIMDIVPVKEGYSTISVGNNYGRIDPYYSWRAYDHDPYNFHKLNEFPYTYQPIPHPKRYTKYYPYNYHYGYGHL
jgi:hypothetical protein